MFFKISLYGWKYINKKWKKVKVGSAEVEGQSINDAKEFLQTKMIPQFVVNSKDYEYSIELIK